jgi:hypothetical protein
MAKILGNGIDYRLSYTKVSFWLRVQLILNWCHTKNSFTFFNTSDSLGLRNTKKLFIG